MCLMKSIDKQQYIQNLKQKATQTSPRNEREYWLQQTSELIEKPVGQIIGLTRHFPHWKWLKYLYEDAQTGDNPKALWWWLLKKTK